jgi:hypothetical protein
MDTKGFNWLCGVMQDGYVPKLGLKISDANPDSQHNFCGHHSLSDTTNRNQPLLFFHMDPTNSIVWTRMSFIGSEVSCRMGMCQNFGRKSLMDPSSRQNFCNHQYPQRHNKQEPTFFILPYGSNKQHCMDKEEFHWLCGVMQDGYVPKLGLKISDGSQQWAKFL